MLSPSPSSPARLALAALSLLAASNQVAAQDSSSSSSSAQAAASSVAQSSAATTAASYAAASASASSTAAAATVSNPLIPVSAISTKCHSFLSSLNSDTTLASCTTPLLSALSAFLPSPSLTSYTSTTSSLSSTLSSLCASTTSEACSDAAIRAQLTAFSGNCSVELNAQDEVVLGAYDALYVLTPLREAVCTTDAAGGWCLLDIVSGSMPAGSTGANATAVDSAVVASASSAAAEAVATNSATPSSEGNSTVSSSIIVTSANDTAQNFKVLAASTSKAQFVIPSPESLYIQITGSIKRLVRRQAAVATGSVASSVVAGVSSPAAAASASASTGASNTTTADNSTTPASTSSSAATSSDELVYHTYALPSLLPSPSTFTSSSLPFLLLSANSTSSSLSSTVLCSSCTKSILASYVAFEARMPYALGLANSPVLGGQGELWTKVGETCGSGFLEATAKEAGQENLTGGVNGRKVGGVAAVIVAVVVALMA